MDSAILFFKDGGFFMIPIAVLLLTATAIIIERFYMIRFRYSANAAGLMQKVQRLILDNNIDEAIKLCNSQKSASIFQVFKAALINVDRPFDQVQDHVEVATLNVIPKLQNRLPYLFTIANVTTLLGLLGTIFGLIRTFEAVGAVEGSQKQELLSAGISTAMNTTAFGLIVAVPCMLAYGYLFNRINGMVDEIEHYSARLLLLLRTGSEYFDNFNPEDLVTTEQTPKPPSHAGPKPPRKSIPKPPPKAPDKDELGANHPDNEYIEEEESVIHEVSEVVEVDKKKKGEGGEDAA